MPQSTRRWTVLALPSLALAAALGLGTVVGAQDATPEAMAGMEAAHPGHIHAGTCEELGDVVFPLADAVSVMEMATPSVADEGTQGAVAVSVTTVEASLDDILAAEHAINFHESAENIENYIACGDLTGEPTDGMLTIELAELNDSGYDGVAELEDAGDGTTLVTVELTAAGDAATPAADEAAAGDGGSVTIVDFAYDPAEITVPVGGTVSWTNEDAAPHTATAQDREALQSGTIASGESYEQTFDTAGTYEYFCEFHPNMQGTVVVE